MKFSVIAYAGNFITNIESKLEFELNIQKIVLEKTLSQAMPYFCLKKPE